MTLVTQAGSSSPAVAQVAKAGVSSAAVPECVKDFCLELPQSSQPPRTDGLSRAYRQVLADFVQTCLERRSPVQSLDFHLSQNYQGNTADVAKAALVRRGLLHEDATTRGVIPTRAGLREVWDNGVARARLADQGRNLFVAADFSFVVTQANRAFLSALGVCGKGGVAPLDAIVQELGVSKVDAVVDVVKKLHEAGRVRVRPTSIRDQFEVVDLVVEATISRREALDLKPPKRPVVVKETPKSKAVIAASPAALITEIVASAGREGVSVREIRAALQAKLPACELTNKQLFNFLNNPSSGFESERLSKKRASDGALWLYRVAK